jgi:dTDP-4-dehydrorhamnose reductase
VTRVLLFGGQGQVGWELVRALQGFGECDVVGRDRADFNDPASVRHAVVDRKPDWVVNCAAYTQVDRAEDEPERAWRINAGSVEAVATACAGTGARLVHFSTDYVFDGLSAAPYREGDPTGPLGVYGESKLRGEQAIRAGHCHHLILRTSWVYAARGSNFLLTMLRLARERPELRVVQDQVGAPTWARFIAQATAAMMWRCRLNEDAQARLAAGATVNLTNAGATSWFGFASALLEEAHSRSAWPLPSIVPIPTSEYPTRARRPLNSRLDLAALKSDWGIDAPDWRASMRLCLEEALARPPT